MSETVQKLIREPLETTQVLSSKPMKQKRKSNSLIRLASKGRSIPKSVVTKKNDIIKHQHEALLESANEKPKSKSWIMKLCCA